MGPTGPRWAPWWSHELCYLGIGPHERNMDHCYPGFVCDTGFPTRVIPVYCSRRMIHKRSQTVIPLLALGQYNTFCFFQSDKLTMNMWQNINKIITKRIIGMYKSVYIRVHNKSLVAFLTKWWPIEPLNPLEQNLVKTELQHKYIISR